MRFIPIAWALAAAAITACSSAPAPTGSSSDPKTPSDSAVDPGNSAETVTSASADPPSEAEIQALVNHRCTQCHDARSPVLDLAAGFVAETAEKAPSKSQLCKSSKYRALVVPGDREASLLYRKITKTADCGNPMPYRRGDVAFTADEIERVGLFIDALGGK